MNLPFGNKISLEDRAHFAKSLSVMLESGIPINQAVKSIKKQVDNKKLKEILQKVEKDVNQGISLGKSLEDYEENLSSVFVNLIKAGEKSGNLEKNLSFLSQWIEQESDLRSEVSQATLYPKFVLATAVIIGGGLSLFLLPRLVPLFKQLNVSLPLPTRILMAISGFVANYYAWIILAFISFFVLIVGLLQFRKVRKWRDHLYLKLPFVGDLVQDYNLALFSHLASTTLKSGIPITQTLSIIQSAAPNLVFKDVLDEVQRKVNAGTPLSEVMEDYPLVYDQTTMDMVITGEKSGRLQESFNYLSEMYTKSVRKRVRKLPTVLEPALLLVLGLIVAFVAISIILPIFNITSGL